MNHEPRDASVRVIGTTAGIIAMLVALSIAVSAWMYFGRYHHAETKPSIGRQTAFTEGPSQKIDIERDTAAVARAANERLRGYGWVDKNAGIARIPIERAMELTANGVKPAPAPKPPGQVP
jgi:hypothetical protein